MSSRRYSFVIPVYNRPEELDELLETIALQRYRNFEIVVVEDGSKKKADAVVEKFGASLDISYHYIENVGQGFARNHGFAKAKGEYFVILDSDTLLPDHYLEAVETRLNRNYLDAYGGPDRAARNFSDLQKAISYAMTSVFTTGGIRGQASNVGGDFQPRSFNMGMSREVYEKTGGFRLPYMAEDIELSIRMKDLGFRVGLISEAFVYHKRRGDFKSFWKQVHFFGRGRIHLNRLYPGTGMVKPVHAFPSLFTLFCVLIPVWYFVFPLFFVLSLLALQVFMALILVDASWKYRNLKTGLLSVVAAFVQLLGYGTGFIREAVAKLLG